MSNLLTEQVLCNQCHSHQVNVVYPQISQISTPGTQVVQCAHCGLVYLNPRLKNLADNFTLSEDYLTKFYLPDCQKSGVLNSDGSLNEAQNYAFFRHPLRQMRPYRLLNRVLDVGCAVGLFLAAVRYEQWEGCGVEPAAPLGEYGRRNFALNIYEGELIARKFDDHYFDVVTLWMVAEHLLDPLSILKEAYRILRPGGLLMLSMPNWSSLTHEVLGEQWGNFVTDHFYYFTPATLRAMLEAAGFKQLTISADAIEPDEWDEIASKLDRQTTAALRQQFELSGPSHKGSSIFAKGEKPMTTFARLQKAQQLVWSGNLRGLGREIRNFIDWKLALRPK